MGRIRGLLWVGVVGLPAAVLLGGCTVSADPIPSPPIVASSSPTTSGQADKSDLSEFEKQLPLTGTFVSQFADTEGTVKIERRSEGSVWIVIKDFHTGAASDLRLYLKADELVQDSDGHWGSSEDGYEIAVHDLDTANYEIEVPGAWDMPAMHTLTIRDYTPPDYPSLGSVALH